MITYKYFSINSLIKNLYSTLSDSSASIKHNGGNRIHHQLLPSPLPKVINNDS